MSGKSDDFGARYDGCAVHRLFFGKKKQGCFTGRNPARGSDHDLFKTSRVRAGLGQAVFWKCHISGRVGSAVFKSHASGSGHPDKPTRGKWSDP